MKRSTAGGFPRTANPSPSLMSSTSSSIAATPHHLALSGPQYGVVPTASLRASSCIGLPGPTVTVPTGTAPRGAGQGRQLPRARRVSSSGRQQPDSAIRTVPSAADGRSERRRSRQRTRGARPSATRPRSDLSHRHFKPTSASPSIGTARGPPIRRARGSFAMAVLGMAVFDQQHVGRRRDETMAMASTGRISSGGSFPDTRTPGARGAGGHQHRSSCSPSGTAAQGRALSSRHGSRSIPSSSHHLAMTLRSRLGRFSAKRDGWSVQCPAPWRSTLWRARSFSSPSTAHVVIVAGR